MSDHAFQLTLPPDLAQFVNTLVERGTYGSVEGAVQDAVRLMREREQEDQARFESLRRDIMEGIEEADRGEVVELDIEAIIAAGHRELARRKNA